ncbi:MAG: hypothetical protein JWO38_830, partial [Gemmataceae bacterium]|nr:hypothetical protein [Gemmataceae bacterium]
MTSAEFSDVSVQAISMAAALARMPGNLERPTSDEPVLLFSGPRVVAEAIMTIIRECGFRGEMAIKGRGINKCRKVCAELVGSELCGSSSRVRQGGPGWLSYFVRAT